MIKFGKWIGAGLGLALGGPLGGLLGLLIGNAIDNIQTEPLNSNGTPGTPPVSGRGDFLSFAVFIAFKNSIRFSNGTNVKNAPMKNIKHQKIKLLLLVLHSFARLYKYAGIMQAYPSWNVS